MTFQMLGLTQRISREEAAIRELQAALDETKRGGLAEGAHIHIVHLSDAGTSLNLIKDAKGNGASVSVETCPHYLAFSAEEVKDGDTRFKCAPPIRDEVNRQKLWNALLEGHIDMLSSDHSPSIPELKLPEEGEFLRAWGGISSLQFVLPATWSSGLKYGITLNQLATWWCEKPTKLIGLQNKGTIVSGNHADFVVWDPNIEFTIDDSHVSFHKHPEKYWQLLLGEILCTVVASIPQKPAVKLSLLSKDANQLRSITVYLLTDQHQMGNCHAQSLSYATKFLTKRSKTRRKARIAAPSLRGMDTHSWFPDGYLLHSPSKTTGCFSFLELTEVTGDLLFP
ncbi:hypothetical protein HPP92_014320 [Vanilla planifolia]|uniref:Amidohydrolase-related domain-containing protein n=1 Tax=Vanilla planifolia TaxID=51239 RepID=A0A835QL65_VANPL|nr:hypothetical protein HPP92_014320 [Vanilla planifolia]